MGTELRTMALARALGTDYLTVMLDVDSFTAALSFQSCIIRCGFNYSGILRGFDFRSDIRSTSKAKPAVTVKTAGAYVVVASPAPVEMNFGTGNGLLESSVPRGAPFGHR